MIAYVKYNDARRAEFQLVTKILDEGGTLFVTKESATTQSRGFLVSLRDKYNWLTMAKLPFSIAEPTFTDNIVRFEYSKGGTLDDEIKSAVINKSAEELETAFDKYFKLIKDIPNNDGNLPAEFIKIFGDSNKKYKLTSVGCLDVTPENLVTNGSGYMHFDYEWTFNFPIPTDWILVRALINTYTKYRDYNISDILAFGELMKRFNLKRENIQQILVWENNFQLYVHDGEKRTAPIVGELFLTLGQNTFVDSISERDMLLIEANKKNDTLLNELITVQTSLVTITSSRTWKIRNIVARILGKKVVK